MQRFGTCAAERKSSVVTKKVPKSKENVLKYYFGKKAKVTHTNSTRVLKGHQCFSDGEEICEHRILTFPTLMRS